MDPAPEHTVIIVSPGDSFFHHPFQRAFERRGFKCVLFDYRQGWVFKNRIIRLVIRRFPFLRFLKTAQVRNTNRALIRLVQRVNPQYLFVQKGDNVYPETIEEIAKMGVITIGLFNDMMDHWNVISKLAPVFDYFFAVDNMVVRRLRAELALTNCHYMALAAEPVADPFTYRDDTYAISFVGQPGSGHSDREALLETVGDLGLNIWGTKEWLSTPLSKYYRGPADGGRRMHIYSHSKIVLDTTWDLMPSDFVSTRIFEATACGALAVTDCANQKVKEAYHEDTEIIICRNGQRMREKVAYFLSHDKERDAVARAGHRRTVSEHTFDARVGRMLGVIASRDSA